MKTLLLLIVSLFCLPAAFAQAPAAPPRTPTTHVLAIGHLTVPREQALPVLPKEVNDTVRLYLGGKLEQWYSRSDGKGVVFVLQVNNVEDARALLEALPLGKAKFMEFDYIPLGPLAPLNLLLKDSPAGAAK